ncbi:WXG100 family type VII secretion target [Leifsonia sp. fls2-241-R2A-40a]|uniref:WXG100 family type VII secretion target n=1 Tax=Leifsonia sp. fls2-241-R2A-40a TaxID=3040290 RepID=UPI00254F06A4|nr:WXG100 family type VII secretion target [Leifsonia sp. fls2-241-R2A-40a]
MTNITIDYGQLTATAARLGHGQSQLEATLRELKATVDGLVASGFTTERASSAFQLAYDEFTTGATRVVSGLQGMAHFLHATADSFGQTDASLAGALRGA